MLPVVRKEASFHDFHGYERLVEPTQVKGWRTHAKQLLGWEAGIRTPITASRARCPTVERPPSTESRRLENPTTVTVLERHGQADP